jgi:hypothetical protein
MEATLTNAHLTVSGAALRGADLRGANLERANLEGARADNDTTWPDGFDPKAAGVIFEDEVIFPRRDWPDDY